MQALVLERARQLALREIELAERLGPRDVRVADTPSTILRPA